MRRWFLGLRRKGSPSFQTFTRQRHSVYCPTPWSLFTSGGGGGLSLGTRSPAPISLKEPAAGRHIVLCRRGGRRWQHPLGTPRGDAIDWGGREGKSRAPNSVNSPRRAPESLNGRRPAAAERSAILSLLPHAHVELLRSPQGDLPSWQHFVTYSLQTI